MASGTSVRNRNNHASEPASAAEPIAIIGMRGRFPGANDLDQFWNNLAEGVESISILSQEEIKAAGIPGKFPAFRLRECIARARWRGSGDAQFFGFSARDATLTDPQHRLFLETAWEALEDAGYDPAQVSGPIGVFGGSELSTYLYHLYQNLEALKYIDGMQLMMTNDKDHLCTQVSYWLNLRGHRIVVQNRLHFARRCVAGVRKPAGPPLRHGIGWRSDGARSAARRILLCTRLDLVARWPLPPL
jgi:acyl transferase domain-containing protein